MWPFSNLPGQWAWRLRDLPLLAHGQGCYPTHLKRQRDDICLGGRLWGVGHVLGEVHGGFAEGRNPVARGGSLDLDDELLHSEEPRTHT